MSFSLEVSCHMPGVYLYIKSPVMVKTEVSLEILRDECQILTIGTKHMLIRFNVRLHEGGASGAAGWCRLLLHLK